MSMRPYELPRHLYAVWFDVGHQLGPDAQSVVEVALCSGRTKVYTDQLIDGFGEQIKRIAARRNVILQTT